MNLEQVATPALILDPAILDHNLRGMAEKALSHGVELRPHIKTHKSPVIAQKQMNLGACGIAVATLVEAGIFEEAGVEDITHAYPLDPGKIAGALKLAERMLFRVTLDDLSAAEALEKAAGNRGQTIHAWLKIDSGYHRAGVDPKSGYAMQLAQYLHGAPHVKFDGLLTHAGHAYRANTREDLKKIASQERDTLIEFRERLEHKGIGPVLVSIGSTPTIAETENLEGVDEIRPGNYVFHDWTQVCLGSCKPEECAVSVLATVVSNQPGGDHVVIDAGALALSHDPGPVHIVHEESRGRVLVGGESKELHKALRVTNVSQEHGIVRGEGPGDLAELRVGSKIRVLPNHSCLAVALFDEYVVVEGQRVVDRWDILRGRSKETSGGR